MSPAGRSISAKESGDELADRRRHGARGDIRARRRAVARPESAGLRARGERPRAHRRVLRPASARRRAVGACRQYRNHAAPLPRDASGGQDQQGTAMTTPWRLALFGLALVVLVPAVWHVAEALPAFGAPTEQYGAAVDALLTAARHVTNMVAAVNF